MTPAKQVTPEVPPKSTQGCPALGQDQEGFLTVTDKLAAILLSWGDWKLSPGPRVRSQSA